MFLRTTHHKLKNEQVYTYKKKAQSLMALQHDSLNIHMNFKL